MSSSIFMNAYFAQHSWQDTALQTQTFDGAYWCILAAQPKQQQEDPSHFHACPPYLWFTRNQRMDPYSSLYLIPKNIVLSMFHSFSSLLTRGKHPRPSTNSCRVMLPSPPLSHPQIFHVVLAEVTIGPR